MIKNYKNCINDNELFYYKWKNPRPGQYEGLWMREIKYTKEEEIEKDCELVKTTENWVKKRKLLESFNIQTVNNNIKISDKDAMGLLILANRKSVEEFTEKVEELLMQTGKPDKVKIYNKFTEITGKTNVSKYLQNLARCTRKNWAYSVYLTKSEFIKLFKSSDFEIIGWAVEWYENKQSHLMAYNYHIEGYKLEYGKEKLEYKTKAKLYDISLLSELKKDSNYLWFVQKLDKSGADFELIPFDKNQEMILSWYGPTNYIIRHKDNTHEYRYSLSDQNNIKSMFDIGSYCKTNETPKSFPVLIKYKLPYDRRRILR